MRLKDLIVDSLKPYQHQLADWDKSDFEIFFMGFGNLTVISPAGFEFKQTFFSNATDICLALDELGFEKLDYEERDFYWMIHAEPAIIHPDLLRCLKDNGNQVFKMDSEEEIECFTSEQGIDFEKVEI
jgi:hypothetical protein